MADTREHEPTSRHAAPGASLVIRDPAQARFFADDRRLRVLMMFAPAPRSIGEVAEALGTTIGRLFYSVDRLLGAKLLRVTEERKRAGKPVKLYQAVAAEFLVPDDLLPRPYTHGLSDELREALDRCLANRDLEGILFAAEPSGGITMRVAGPAEHSKTVADESWLTLTLPDDAALAMARELRELMARYKTFEGEGREYIVHTAIAPRRP